MSPGSFLVGCEMYSSEREKDSLRDNGKKTQELFSGKIVMRLLGLVTPTDFIVDASRQRE